MTMSDSSTISSPAGPAYTRTAVALHWLIAALIGLGFAIGLVVSDLPFSPQKLKWVAYHKWIGVTVFILAAVRLLWRLTHRPPPAVAMPAWQLVAAKFSHALLYTLMFVLPLLGWLFSSAAGVPVVYLGLVRLPDLVAKNKALADSLIEMHVNCAWLLCGIVAVHAAAALKHHFLDGDDTLRRMLRWTAPGAPQ